MNYLFGFPVDIYKINPNNYNKEKIVSDIIDNYKIDPNRNNWDNSSNVHNSSNIHHELDDKGNVKFKKIDYSSLIPLYNEKIKEYVN